MYFDNGILWSSKKKNMQFLATWIKLEYIILSEVSQKGND